MLLFVGLQTAEIYIYTSSLLLHIVTNIKKTFFSSNNWMHVITENKQLTFLSGER